MAGITLSRAHALVINGSFELGTFVSDGNGAMTLNPGSSALTGWSVINGQLAWIKNGNAFTNVAASEGTRLLDLTGYDDAAPYGGVQQSFGTTIGTTYNVAFDLGTNTIYGPTASLQASAGSYSQMFSFTATTPLGGYQRFDFDFTATSASTLLKFVGASPSRHGIAFDNVVVTPLSSPPPAAVPDGGATAALLAFALMSFVLPAAGRTASFSRTR